ncbi:MAG: endo-1,4-beta-xylanase [Polyangiaceae bacterium]
MPRNVLSAGLLLLLGCSSTPASPVEQSGGGASAGAGAPAASAGSSGSSAGAPAAGNGGTLGGQGGSATATSGSTNGGSASAGAGTVAGASNGGSASGGAAGSSGSAGAAGAAHTPCASHAGATTLAAKYADCFPIGAAVDSTSYTTHAAVLKAHFNSVTPENEMKFSSLEPSSNSFNYAAADNIVNFAISNNMRVRGHTLVWYQQNPDWLFAGATSQTLLARMQNHIAKVVGHFKGKAYAWDVVNEAIMNDGNYRTGNEADSKQSSSWYGIMGKSYIAEAFKAAHAADPDAKLFYNDFYDYIPAKRQGIYNMLKELLAAGVPVHGVGMQCHINIQPSTDTANQAYYQDVANLEQAIQLYSSLGLEVQVTEMDNSLYVPGVTYTSATFYTAATFTDALKAKQAARYREFFELFRKYSDVISGVTLWGIADDNTWLSEFDSGRKDFPLLFDTDHQPKPAYDAVMDF